MKHEHPHRHGDGHSHGRQHAGPRASLTNWRESDLPFGKKVRVATGNLWIKVRKRRTCCGHPGEPGC